VKLRFHWSFSFCLSETSAFPQSLKQKLLIKCLYFNCLACRFVVLYKYTFYGECFMKPIVKWAGGKTQLLQHITEMLPPDYNHYFEPFLGGGAVLLHLMPPKATVNDINYELINMYLQIQQDPHQVIQELTKLDDMHETSDGSFYYFIRNEFNHNLAKDSAEQAARFIYINKHCFNGLFRVNIKGHFNVPFNNKKSGKSFDAEHTTITQTLIMFAGILISLKLN